MRTIRARLTGLTLLAILAAVVLAACGSSSSSSSSSAAASASGTGGSGSSSTRTAQRAKLQACLKQHGVALPSRPAGSRPPQSGGGYGGPPGGGYGGGFFGGGSGGGAGSRFNNPKFRAALKACGADFGGGGSAAGRGRFTQATLAKFSACVKQHGYTLPKPNLKGGAIYPTSVEHNTKFQAAAKACQADLRPSGGAPPSSGTSTS